MGGGGGGGDEAGEEGYKKEMQVKAVVNEDINPTFALAGRSKDTLSSPQE